MTSGAWPSKRLNSWQPSEHRELTKMKTTRQLKREAKQLFRLCLVEGKVDEGIARKVVQAILQSRRRGHLALLGHFQRLLKLEYARHTAEVESAVPLPADLQAS